MSMNFKHDAGNTEVTFATGGCQHPTDFHIETDLCERNTPLYSISFSMTLSADPLIGGESPFDNSSGLRSDKCNNANYANRTN